MKTAKKALALLLSAMLLFSLCGVWTFALEGAPLPTADSDDLMLGDWYFDLDGYIWAHAADEQEAAALRRQTYYLSDDANTFTVVSDEGEQSYLRADGSDFFTHYLWQHQRFSAADAALFDVLYTKTETLEPGDRWMDYPRFMERNNLTDDYLYNFFLSKDGVTIKYIDVGHAGPNPVHVGTAESDPVAFSCIRTLAPFRTLPESPDGLEAGDYWFDRAAFTADLTSYLEVMRTLVGPEEIAEFEPYYNAYLEAPALLSEDDLILRMPLTVAVEAEGQTATKIENNDSRAEEPAFTWHYLRRVGEELYPGFTLLPTADSPALANGDYWFDLYGWLSYFEAVFSPEGGYYTLIKFYLSDDGNTLRLYPPFDRAADYPRNDDPEYVFSFLRRHGEAAPDLTGYTAVVDDPALARAGDRYFDLPLLTGAVVGGPGDYETAEAYEAAAASVAALFREHYAIFRNDLTGELIGRFGSTYITPAEDHNGTLTHLNEMISLVTEKNAVAPACAAPGAEGDLYIEREGEEVLLREGGALEPLGHSCGAPVWTWAEDHTASAVFSCERCGEAFSPEVTVTARVAAEPTAAENGSKIYTACVTFEGKTYTDVKEEVLPAVGSSETPADDGGVGSAILRFFDQIRDFFNRILDFLRGLFGR